MALSIHAERKWRYRVREAQEALDANPTTAAVIVWLIARLEYETREKPAGYAKRVGMIGKLIDDKEYHRCVVEHRRATIALADRFQAVTGETSLHANY